MLNLFYILEYKKDLGMIEISDISLFAEDAEEVQGDGLFC